MTQGKDWNLHSCLKALHDVLTPPTSQTSSSAMLPLSSVQHTPHTVGHCTERGKRIIEATCPQVALAAYKAFLLGCEKIKCAFASGPLHVLFLPFCGSYPFIHLGLCSTFFLERLSVSFPDLK
jgi:hypothetical protein